MLAHLNFPFCISWSIMFGWVCFINLKPHCKILLRVEIESFISLKLDHYFYPSHFYYPSHILSYFHTLSIQTNKNSYAF